MALMSFGEALIDFLPADKPGEFKACAGGAPANVAVALACLGHNSFFVGGMSADAMGDFLRHEMASRGVNLDYIALIKHAPTSLVLVTLDSHGERSFQFYREGGADALFSGEHLRIEAFKYASIFHFCSNTLTHLSLNEATWQALELAHKHHLIVSFDVNLRLSLWSEQQRTHLFARVMACVARSHIIKLASEECAYLAGQAGCTEAQWIAQCLTNDCTELVVVTDGGKPVNAYTRHGQLCVTPPEVTPVDTTGAGDAFIAGLLANLDTCLLQGNGFAHWLSEETLQQALVQACANGAKACQIKGAFEAMPAG